MSPTDPEHGTVVVAETCAGKYAHAAYAGRHTLAAYDPVKVGGTDTGTGPY